MTALPREPRVTLSMSRASARRGSGSPNAPSTDAADRAAPASRPRQPDDRVKALETMRSTKGTRQLVALPRLLGPQLFPLFEQLGHATAEETVEVGHLE